ncbi:MAG: hypothetical protein NT007_03265 [Candidatus Kapabacteria bacterium]|nr:hypothetical protein [Candidatus Kapabacteria bacterium]
MYYLQLRVLNYFKIIKPNISKGRLHPYEIVVVAIHELPLRVRFGFIEGTARRAHAGIIFQCQSVDSCMHTNDNFSKYFTFKNNLIWDIF